MKITPNQVPQTSISATSTTPPSQPTSRDVSVEATEAGGTFVPSAEWIRLLTLLKEEPEIRTDKVLDALEGLQAGTYMTAESAEKTAEAILRSMK